MTAAVLHLKPYALHHESHHTSTRGHGLTDSTCGTVYMMMLTKLCTVLAQNDHSSAAALPAALVNLMH